MSSSRRYAVIGAVTALVWYVCTLIFWALPALTDSVPVGVDYTLKSPAFVSVEVECRGLFDASARDDSPLPVLKAQPQGVPELGYQREPCSVVQRHARILLALDTAAFLAIVTAGGVLAFRKRGPATQTTDATLAGLRAG